MIARTLDISEKLMEQAGWRTCEDIKAACIAGDHGNYVIDETETALPDDAVISVEYERLPHMRARRYIVLSDTFTEDDPPWITPSGRWKDGVHDHIPFH